MYDKFLPTVGKKTPVAVHSDTRRGGGISFRDSLGKPPDQCLWEDLVERIGCKRIGVFRHCDEEWTIGISASFGGNAACVYLDKDGNVSDIHLYAQ